MSEIASAGTYGIPRAFARVLLLGFMLGLANAPAAASEFEGKWRGVAETTQTTAGVLCEPRFGFYFEITGNEIRGRLRGSVDEKGRIKAKSNWAEAPGVFEGVIRDSTATGDWRFIGACRGTWTAWRLHPQDTIFPEKIEGVEIREVVFTTKIKDANPVDSVNTISINSGHIYILVKWKIDLKTIKSFVARYEVHDGEGKLVIDQRFFYNPRSSRWNTWMQIPITAFYHKPGVWPFVVYFDDHKVIESKLTVLPE